MQTNLARTTTSETNTHLPSLEELDSACWTIKIIERRVVECWFGTSDRCFVVVSPTGGAFDPADYRFADYLPDVGFGDGSANTIFEVIDLILDQWRPLCQAVLSGRCLSIPQSDQIVRATELLEAVASSDDSIAEPYKTTLSVVGTHGEMLADKLANGRLIQVYRNRSSDEPLYEIAPLEEGDAVRLKKSFPLSYLYTRRDEFGSLLDACDDAILIGRFANHIGKVMARSLP